MLSLHWLLIGIIGVYGINVAPETKRITQQEEVHATRATGQEALDYSSSTNNTWVEDARHPRDADPLRTIRPIPVTMRSMKLYPASKKKTTAGASVLTMFVIWAWRHAPGLIVTASIVSPPGSGARETGIKAWGCLMLINFISILPTIRINAQALTGYDTAGRYSDEKITMKTVSLLGVESCSAVQTQSYTPPTEHNVQVIYKPSESVVTTIQCSIKLTVDIYPCYESIFRSDLYPSDTIDLNRVMPLTADECRAMNAKGWADIDVYGTTLRLDRATHSTQIKSKVIYGVKKQDGGCRGATIEVSKVKREDVVVIATVSYFQKEWRGIYSSSARRIHVGDLVTFAPSEKIEGSCDSEYGCFYTKTADSLPSNDCERTQPFLKGRALVYRPAADSDLSAQGYLDIVQITSNMDETQGTTLTLGEATVICSTLVRRTNIPRLYVNFYEKPGHKIVNHRLANTSMVNKDQSQMIDILSSSSNLYLRGTLSISDQFDRVSFRLCELRRAALLGILRDLLTAGPAPLLDYREGVLFRRVGSVVYVFMGNPVTCRLRPTSECYNEIPVTLELENEEVPAFLTSKGRIIVNNATIISCGNNQAMHYIHENEVVRMNKTLSLFQDLVLSEMEENEAEGSWFCQFPGQFVRCNPPSSLSPSIGTSDHFLGIKGQAIHQSIFGSEGRETLYQTQMEGFNREVVWTTFTHRGSNGLSSSAGDILISNLSEEAQRRIRSIVLPTIVFLFGDLSTSIGQFLIGAFILNIIYRLICLLGRVVMVYRNKGCSRHIFICVFEGIYNAIIPWRAAAEEKKRSIEEMSAKLDQQGEDLRNLWTLHYLPKAPEQSTMPRSPLARARQMGLGHYPFLDGATHESMPLSSLSNPHSSK